MFFHQQLLACQHDHKKISELRPKILLCLNSIFHFQFVAEISQVENAIKLKNNIIIYGKNSNDESIYVKYNQINKLGGLAYIYVGGLFEWLMLQDIYGDNEFPTTKKELDILKFKPNKSLNVHLLEY